MDLIYSQKTSISVAEMEGRLKAVVKTHQFSVLNVTDLRAKIQSNDLEFPLACMVFDVCNPHRAKDVLDHSMAISTAFPCRISVYEEGDQTTVATLLPSKVLGLFGVEGIDSAAQVVERALIAIIDEVTSE